VVATTTFVGDVVKQVGGDLVEVHTLLQPGMDPHSYDPSPQDLVNVANAQVVFASGAGLEEFLQTMIENAASKGTVVEVSDGIQLRRFSLQEQVALDEDEQTASGDPHTWTDPNNVMVWVENIRQALAAADPAHSQAYQANADQYTQALKDLDTWIKAQVETISPEKRDIVSDHMVFGYFADRYGFKQIGAVVPGYSSMASPSAQDLAAIETAIQDYHVPAIFVGNTVNTSLSQQIAQDTGIHLVNVYTGSLSDANGPAATYLDFIRFDVNAFVSALK